MPATADREAGAEAADNPNAEGTSTKKQLLARKPICNALRPTSVLTSHLRCGAPENEQRASQVGEKKSNLKLVQTQDTLEESDEANICRISVEYDFETAEWYFIHKIRSPKTGF
ncbi:MAG: hypothetical protein ABI177_06825 [Edaphobacter sp.]